MANVRREKKMTVPVGCLYRAITDFAYYPEFLPEVVGAQIQAGGSAEQPLVKFELQIVKRFEYILQFDIIENKHVKWQLVESNFFKTNEGHWSLKPLDSQTTQVEYELNVSFGFLVPGWITRKLTEVNLPRMFGSFESRAQHLASK